MVTVLKAKAAKSRDVLEFQPIGRGYAWLFTYRRVAK